jgi:hypothetical protein
MVRKLWRGRELGALRLEVGMEGPSQREPGHVGESRARKAASVRPIRDEAQVQALGGRVRQEGCSNARK